MCKMILHDPFGHLKHKLWPKKGTRVKLPFDSRPLKIRNRLDLLVCRWHATYCLDSNLLYSTKNNGFMLIDLSFYFRHFISIFCITIALKNNNITLYPWNVLMFYYHLLFYVCFECITKGVQGFLSIVVHFPVIFKCRCLQCEYHID